MCRTSDTDKRSPAPVRSQPIQSLFTPHLILLSMKFITHPPILLIIQKNQVYTVPQLNKFHLKQDQAASPPSKPRSSSPSKNNMNRTQVRCRTASRSELRKLKIPALRWSIDQTRCYSEINNISLYTYLHLLPTTFIIFSPRGEGYR